MPRCLSMPGCGFKPIAKNNLDNQVLERLGSEILKDEVVRELVRLSNLAIDELNTSEPSSKQALETELTKVLRKLARLVSALEDDLGEVKEIPERIRELRARSNQIEKELYTIAGQAAEKVAYIDEGEMVGLINEVRHVMTMADSDTAKSILRSFIRRIEVKLPQVTVEFSLPQNLSYDSISTTL